ncbi:MAG: hypothetical protein ACRDBO_00495 [Lachnospiraceae bacterium]
MTKTHNPRTNKEVKSSAFSAYFSNPKNAAKLFEALQPGTAVSPDDIDFTTLNGVLFLARKNDLAFTVKQKILVISEHQATINLNMPLRDAIYYGRTMEKLIEPKALYRTKRIPIPTPEFYVFYNGNEACPNEEILHLSDSYLVKTMPPMLELTVKIININLPENHPILESCRPLYEYSWFIQCIKDHLNSGYNRDEAIIQSIKDCQSRGFMEDFLVEHGTEAINMLFTEFNMEDALAIRGEEKYAEGLEEGAILKVKELIIKKIEKGKTIETIAEELEETTDYIHSILSAEGHTISDTTR